MVRPGGGAPTRAARVRRPVDPAVAIHFTPHHAYGANRPVQARLLVLRGDMSEAVEGADDVDLLARAGNPGVVDYGEVVRQAQAMFNDLVEQGMSEEEAFRTVGEAIGDDLPEPPTDPDGFADWSACTSTSGRRGQGTGPCPAEADPPGRGPLGCARGGPIR